MKEINVLSSVNGHQIILVDDEDYDMVSKFKWFIYSCIQGGKRARTMYAVATINSKTVRMHRLLLNASDPKVLIDHKDHNGLNNQRSNLRIASNRQNQANMRPFKKNKTGFKGVSYHKGDKKYMVFLRVDRKNRYFGSFSDAKQAAIKYNEVSKMYNGEFAYQNPI